MTVRLLEHWSIQKMVGAIIGAASFFLIVIDVLAAINDAPAGLRTLLTYLGAGPTFTFSDASTIVHIVGIAIGLALVILDRRREPPPTESRPSADEVLQQIQAQRLTKLLSDLQTAFARLSDVLTRRQLHVYLGHASRRDLPHLLNSIEMASQQELRRLHQLRHIESIPGSLQAVMSLAAESYTVLEFNLSWIQRLARAGGVSSMFEVDSPALESIRALFSDTAGAQRAHECRRVATEHIPVDL